MRFPVIVKPNISVGGKGVFLCSTQVQFSSVKKTNRSRFH